jgi:hypothetical protein
MRADKGDVNVDEPYLGYPAHPRLIRLSVSPLMPLLIILQKLPRPNRFGEIFVEKRKLTQITSQVFFRNGFVCDGGKFPRPNRLGETFFEKCKLM